MRRNDVLFTAPFGAICPARQTLGVHLAAPNDGRRSGRAIGGWPEVIEGLLGVGWLA